MIDIVSPEHREAANKLREILATYRENEDLINIGAYVKGSNPKIDLAIEKMPVINEFLRQGLDESSDFEGTVQRLIQLCE
jgi:flagellum-specific ATP synthase